MSHIQLVNSCRFVTAATENLLVIVFFMATAAYDSCSPWVFPDCLVGYLTASDSEGPLKHGEEEKEASTSP